MNHLKELIKKERRWIKNTGKNLNKRLLKEDEDEEKVHNEYKKFCNECQKKVNKILKERNNWGTDEFSYDVTDMYDLLLRVQLNFIDKCVEDGKAVGDRK